MEKIKLAVYVVLNRKFRKNPLTLFDCVGYDVTLNGYSLIPSWWRDRPNETQQPATEKARDNDAGSDIF